MRRFIITGISMAGLVFGALAHADEPPLDGATLKQCYELALKRSEVIAIQAQVIKEAQGRFMQSLGTILPQVSFVDTEKFQDGTKGGGTNASYVPQRQFVFTQPLFSGFKEFAAMAASKAEKRQRRQELIRAQQLLFTDVSDAFYLFKNYQENFKTLEDIHQALQDRMTELTHRESLGRSRSSEVASTEARFYQNEADAEALRSQLEVTRQLMEFLVGRKVVSLAEANVLTADIGPQDTYVAKADTRPDVQAAQEARQVALKQITIARAGFWPTVDLTGDYYTKRVGSNVDWDILLNINVPIFTGTQTLGQVETAQALAEEAKLRLSQTKRQAVLDIENTYTKLISDRKQTDAYKKAVDAAEKSYTLQSADYRNSSVNNLDVLQALEDLQTTRLSYISINNETQRMYWDLKVATGDISDDTL